MGCARAEVNTEVRADGSWQRTLSFSGAGGATGASEGGDALGPKLEEAFVMPSGAGWTISRHTEGSQTTVKASRTLRPGEAAQHDVVVLGGPKEHPTAQLDNEATVHSLGGGRWEYVETLRWTGKAEEGFAVDNDMFAQARAVIPRDVASDESLRAWMKSVALDLWHMMMGPPDPLLGQMLTHPELVEHRIRRDVALSMQRMLSQQLGDKLTPQHATRWCGAPWTRPCRRWTPSDRSRKRPSPAASRRMLR
jgi:hypothetical protein